MQERLHAWDIVCLAALFAGCGGDRDPCTESDGPTPSGPVGCVPGADPTVIGSVAASASVVNEEVAISRRQVVLDDQYAYWSDYAGRILRTPKRGGGTDVVLEASDCSVAALAVDEIGVYFGQNCRVPELEQRTGFPVEGRVAWVAKADDTRHDLMKMQLADVRELRVQDGRVYWVFSDEVATSTLFAAPRAADVPPGAPIETLVRSDAVMLTTAIAQQAVVWYAFKAAELRRTLLSGGASELLAEAAHTESILIDGTSALWITHDPLDDGRHSRHLWRTPVAGGAPQLALAGEVTEHLATDGTDFYGVGFNTADGDVVNRVYRWRSPSFSPEVIAAAIEWPQSVALDATHLYFIQQSLGDPFSLQLVRVAR
jgi:hypothetical protein